MIIDFRLYYTIEESSIEYFFDEHTIERVGCKCRVSLNDLHSMYRFLSLSSYIRNFIDIAIMSLKRPRRQQMPDKLHMPGASSPSMYQFYHHDEAHIVALFK